MLHEETDEGDAYPAAGTEENRLAAFFDQFHKVRIEPNGGHGKDNEKLAEGLHRSKDGSRNAHMDAYGRNDGSKDKVKDEHRKYIFCAHCAAFARPTTGTVPGQKERNGDDGKGPGEFDRDGLIKGLGSQVPHAVPGSGRCRYRRRVVYRRAGKDAESFAAQGIHMERRPKEGEQNRGKNIKEENRRNGLGDFIIRCLDDRCRRRNGGPAADGRTNTDKSGLVDINVHGLLQSVRDDKRRCNGADDDGKALPACCEDDGEVQAKTQKDYGRL